jgi:O-antigen ligase
MKKFLTTFVISALPLYAVLSLSSMAGMNIGFLVVFVALLCGVALYWQKPLPLATPELSESFSEYRFWALALFIACVISLLAAQFFPFSYVGHAPDITWHGYQKSWYLICPFILISLFRYSLVSQPELIENRFENIARFWWYSVLFLSVIAVIQFFTGWPLMQPLPTVAHRFHAILWIGHHLSVASILIFPTFTAMAVAFGHYRRERKIAKFETWVGAAGLLILFLSYARAGWLATLVGIVLLFARYVPRKKLWPSLTALVVILAGASQLSLVKDRIFSTMGLYDRLHLWRANIDFFMHRPLTGIGWLKTQEMSEFYFHYIDPEHYHSYFWGHAHSNFFEMLGGTGIIGVLAFFGWTYFTCRLAIRTANRAEENQQHRWSDFAWGLFIGLVLLQVNGLTNVTLWEGKVMHQHMLAVGLLLMMQLFVPKK